MSLIAPKTTPGIDLSEGSDLWLVAHYPGATASQTSHGLKLKLYHFKLHLKRLEALGVVFGLGLLVLVAAANLYLIKAFNGRIYPGLSIGGIKVGSLSYQSAATTVATATANQKLNFSVNGHTYTARLADLGVTIDAQASAQAAYGAGRSHLIPIFDWLSTLATNNLRLVAQIDQSKLDAYVAKLAAQNGVTAQDATIAVADGQPKLVPAQAGGVVDQPALEALLTSLATYPSRSFNLALKTSLPAVDNRALAASLVKTQAILDNPIELKFGSHRFSPTKSTLASWLLFNATNGIRVAPIANEDKVAAFVKQVAHQIDLPPIDQITTLFNGQIVATTAGQDGQVVDQHQLVVAISNAINLAQPLDLTLHRQPVHYQTITRTADGLNGDQFSSLAALLARFNSLTPVPFGVVISDLSTGNTATLNQAHSFVSASLYKLFVAYGIFRDIDSGKLTYQSRVSAANNTVNGCLYLMITISDNTCGEALGWLVGWSRLDTLLAAQGYSSTFLNNYNSYGGLNGDKHTTASDVALLYERLYSGQLVSHDSSAHFLALLKAQQVNNRLPTGLPAGTVIAHKTGDIEGFVHDAGIVYGPNGPYLICVLSGPWNSPGLAPAYFKELSAAVYDFFSHQ